MQLLLEKENVKCLKCDSDQVFKKGTRISKTIGKVQRYQCKNCKYRFSIYESFLRNQLYKQQEINYPQKAKNFLFILTPKEKIKGLILPTEITPDLAYFCGVLAGDGSICFRKKKNEYSIECVGNPKDEIEFYDILIKNLIKKLFNIEIKLKYHHKKTSYGFTLYSRSILKYLTEVIELPLGKKYGSLKIPPLFLNDKVLIKNFISGVFDTDSHLAIKKRYYPVITAVSKSKFFRDEIKNFLKEEGFKANGYERKQFDIRFKNPAITYSIELSGHAQLKKWLEEINFRHPRFNNKIDLLKEKGKL